jgi:hypothetical protein
VVEGVKTLQTKISGFHPEERNKLCPKRLRVRGFRLVDRKATEVVPSAFHASIVFHAPILPARARKSPPKRGSTYNAHMDENKPRRSSLSFGTRDLLWAMVVVGLALGWWGGHFSSQAKIRNLRSEVLDRRYDKHNVDHLKWKSTELERQVKELAAYAELEQKRARDYWKQLKECEAKLGRPADESK